MPTLIETAQQLVAQAKAKEKCLDLARAVERKLEEFKDASKAGNTGLIVSGVLIVAGAITAFFAPPLGAGLAAGGIAGAANALDAKASAMTKATKELKWAVEDLENCLKR